MLTACACGLAGISGLGDSLFYGSAVRCAVFREALRLGWIKLDPCSNCAVVGDACVEKSLWLCILAMCDLTLGGGAVILI